MNTISLGTPPRSAPPAPIAKAEDTTDLQLLDTLVSDSHFAPGALIPDVRYHATGQLGSQGVDLEFHAHKDRSGQNGTLLIDTFSIDGSIGGKPFHYEETRSLSLRPPPDQQYAQQATTGSGTWDGRPIQLSQPSLDVPYHLALRDQSLDVVQDERSMAELVKSNTPRHELYEQMQAAGFSEASIKAGTVHLPSGDHDFHAIRFYQPPSDKPLPTIGVQQIDNQTVYRDDETWTPPYDMPNLDATRHGTFNGQPWQIHFKA